jgi:nucleoside-diphosphate-sugar epimerase
MRLYGKLKLGDEDVFRRWADQSGGRAVACRIFALSGPHINKHENYALASFILDAISKRPIEIRADHIVRRSYVAIRELMSVVFGLLLDGSSGCTLFDSGGEKMEMQEVAEAVATALGPIPIHRPKIKDGAADDYVGDQLQYDQLLIANAVQAVPFIDQVMETAAFFRTLQDAGVAADAVAC